jgi:hypothetical protein
MKLLGKKEEILVEGNRLYLEQYVCNPFDHNEWGHITHMGFDADGNFFFIAKREHTETYFTITYYNAKIIRQS